MPPPVRLLVLLSALVSAPLPALRVLLLARVPMSCLPAPPALAPWAMVIEPQVMAMTPFAPLVLVQPLMLVQSLVQSLGQSLVQSLGQSLGLR